MNFLINANIGYKVAGRLSEAGYPSLMVIDVLPLGASDEAVLNYSVERECVLITRDKADFGELVFHQNKPFYGVVVLRTQTASNDDDAFQVIIRAIDVGTIGPGEFVSL